MKHVFSILTVACVAFFTLFLSTTTSSCKKGDKGPKGDTGTANVMYSSWLDVNFDPERNSSGDTLDFAATIKAPALTKGILDTGMVKVYWNANYANAPEVFALPFTNLYYLLNVSYSVGQINLLGNIDFSSGTDATGKYWQFRYVIVPGGVKTGRSAVNLNDYQTVKSLYNLKD